MIDNSEGSLILNIQLKAHPQEKEMKAIITLYLGKKVKYKDDFMDVSCAIHKLGNK